MTLIEKVEKAIQDEGILHQGLIRAQPKMYSVQEIDGEGKLSGAFLAVVMPNEAVLGIYRCEKLINL
jgi:hypothetical protein